MSRDKVTGIERMEGSDKSLDGGENQPSGSRTAVRSRYNHDKKVGSTL